MEVKNIEVRLVHFIATMIGIAVVFMGVAYSYGVLSQKVDNLSVQVKMLSKSVSDTNNLLIQHIESSKSLSSK